MFRSLLYEFNIQVRVLAVCFQGFFPVFLCSIAGSGLLQIDSPEVLDVAVLCVCMFEYRYDT